MVLKSQEPCISYFLLSGFSILWIGLTDVVNQNKCVSIKWGKTHLYQTGTKEDCAALQTDSRKWHDYPCDHKMHYICKKPAKHFAQLLIASENACKINMCHSVNLKCGKTIIWSFQASHLSIIQVTFQLTEWQSFIKQALFSQ